MSIYNPYVNIWFIGATISLFIFNKMSQGDDEGSKAIRKDMFLLLLFWPIIWVLVIASLIKDGFHGKKND